jgi:hypothetical protein
MARGGKIPQLPSFGKGFFINAPRKDRNTAYFHFHFHFHFQFDVDVDVDVDVDAISLETSLRDDHARTPTITPHRLEGDEPQQRDISLMIR